MSIDVGTRLELRSPEKRHLPSMRSLWKEAFGDTDEFLDSFFGVAFGFERCRVAVRENEALGALYIFDCEYQNKKIAYIYAVATRKSARGQGICKELMHDTHKYLSDSGYSGAILVPSEPSLFGFYEKLGYKTCSAIGEFETIASNTHVCIDKIEKSEYINSRRDFLLKNSVIQENVSADFLATYASFYKGDGFLLAAYKANGNLHGIELLGEASVASAILRTLGCEKGFFRVPPKISNTINVRPFAMYHTLDAHISSPEYFGIAFDL